MKTRIDFTSIALYCYDFRI